MLVSILEAFEEMNVNVVQARVTCKHFFGMEAIVEDNIDATILNEAILKEVKIEKLGAGYLIVRVTCKKCEEMLVSILEAFEEMNVNVVQARVTCKHFFGMEAIVEDNIDATILNEAILKRARGPSCAKVALKYNKRAAVGPDVEVSRMSVLSFTVWIFLET
ncbi:hypothetical protein BUALT_Bualt03G0039900 [Buddleja alternifolia]|uniref:Plant bHLH transcription factor ACT-like domain-containing protein n=1 Tax=Buddleja alternifolia TaxID=168488 RepID=A0AAV6XT57_9LAMI|nr:hypothetical protein BUALT_Bualt03G0039900 [Buddleja alternifolia]